MANAAKMKEMKARLLRHYLYREGVKLFDKDRMERTALLASPTHLTVNGLPSEDPARRGVA